MNIEDLPEVDLDIESLPIVDLSVPTAKPRPKAKKKVKPVAKSVPQKPVLPPGVNPKEVINFITGQDRQTQQRQQVRQATAEYEASLIQEPQPHKFVPKVRPPIRNLAAEEVQFEQGLVEAEKRRDMQNYEAKLAGRTAPGTTQQLINRFGRGYVGSMESMLKGPTLLNPNARTDPSTRFLYQTPEEKRTRIQEWLPVNEYNNSFVMRASEAIGSSVPFLIGGAAGQAAGLPTWMVSSVLGAASNAGSTYDEAIANGADEQTARLSAIIGSLIGLTEGLGVGRMGIPAEGGKASFATPLMKRLMEAARHHGKEGVEEWIQGYGSKVLDNVNAMVLSGYDPKRAIQEGVWDAGSMGFLTGAFMSGAMGGTTGVLNRFDPEYRQALAEYRQAQAVDKAFKKFLNSQQLGDVREIGIRPGGKAPSAPQFRRGPIEAATIPPKTRQMVPEMGGAMATNTTEPTTIDEFARRLKEAGYDPGDLSQYRDATDLYMTMLGGIGTSGMNDRQWHISYLFEPKENNPWIIAKNRFDKLRPGPPNPQVKPFLQKTVGDLNTREDNLLEWLKHSEAFHKSGDPIVGYYPSQAGTEHGQIDFYRTQNLDAEYGSGLYFYQDPELASERASRRTGNTLSTVQDVYDYPGYEDKVEAKRQEMIQQLINEHADIGIPEEAMTWGKEGRDKAFYKEAKDKVLEEIVDEFINQKPANLRPFYMNITRPYDMDKTVSVEEIRKIGEAVKREYGDEVADSFMNNFNPEDFDERDWAEVTGIKVARELDKLLGRADYYNEDEYYANKLYGPAKIWRAMKRAGYNGLRYKIHEGRIREFSTPEQAEAYADKVGGTVNYKPGVMVSPSETKWMDTGGNNFQMITIPEVLSKGPTVQGSTMWVAWDDEQIKSSTGNSGEFNPDNTEVYRSAKEPKIDREANLTKFLENSAVQVPVYHGTSSQTDIAVIDPSKFNPNSLFGPGYYTTQNPEIAAGGPIGGYSNKENDLPDADEITKQYATFLNNRLAQGGYDLPIQDIIDLQNRKMQFGFYTQDIEKALEARGVKLKSGDFLALTEAHDQAKEDYSNWSREYRAGKPHAYKLYLNIQKPFDINAPVDPTLYKAIESLPDFDYPIKGYDPVTKKNDESPNFENGYDLYQHLVRYLGNKAEVNEWLEAQGYDGITHIGARNKNGKLFDTEEEARAYANETGGRVIPPQRVQTEVPGEFRYVQVWGGDKWQVQGHRVWIAFKPEQVKSATGNVGTFDPTQKEIYKSKVPLLPAEGVPSGMETADDLTFDVMPALSSKYGRAPYLRAPQWFFDAIGDGDSAGVNYGLADLQDLKDKIFMNAPSMDLMEAALDALNDLVQQTRAEGLNHLSFVNISEPEEGHRGIIEHEVTHTAQRSGLIPTLHWLRNHPLISNILYRRINPSMGRFSPTVREQFFDKYEDEGNDKVLKTAAMEMMTYWVQGRSDRLMMSEEEGRQFFKDYINHMRDEYGQEGVDKFMTIARLRPEVLQTIGESNREWGEQAGMSPFGLSGLTPEVSGSFAAKKGPFQKMMDWFKKGGKEVLEQNPPAPDVPEEEPSDVQEPLMPPGRQPGGGAQGPLGALFKEMVSPEYNQILTRTFRRMLEEGGIQADPIDPPFIQVFNALRSGQLQNVEIEKMLEDEGMSMDVFAEQMKETASMAGKTLQSYSEIARFWNTIIDEWEISEGIEKPRSGATGPRLPKSDLEALLRITPIDVRVKRALRGVRNSALGKNLWQRAGNITQKAMLTQLSTYVVNTMTTTSQLPLRVATQGIGAWMYHMAEDKGSFGQRLDNANQDAVWAMRAGLEVLVAMNPNQLRQWANHQGSYTNFARYQTIVSQLEQSFPELHRKLFALSSGTETMRKGKRQLSIANRLVDKVTDNDKRKELLKQIEEYEERLQFNVGEIGKLMNGVEMVYDFCLQPMQFAEYFLRRPMFVGQLTLELQREGISLAQVLAYNAFDQIPRESMERAVNRALEFTYAYMPGTKTGTNYKAEQFVEKAAAGMIDWLNRWGGPANSFLGEPFAKALFNGAKFVYEYSPVGGILPFNRITANWDKQQQVALRNNYVRLGNQAAADQIKVKGTITDPVTNRMDIVKETTREDYDRLAKAMLGTLMYATVHFLRQAFGGPEWWQIKTGEKSPDGRPIYHDIRRLKPFSALFQMYDIVDRIRTGRVGDMDVLSEVADAVAGIRMYDNQMGGSIIESAVDWFRHEDISENAADKAQEEFGKAMAVYITPLMNLQDCIAQFSEEENVKKDTRGSYSIFGPSMERIPFLRRLLPNLTSPVEPGPIQKSVNPMMTQLLGEKKVVGENFAGREWRRLGLYNRSFLTRDPDPAINRAQNVAFQNLVGSLAQEFENHPGYLAATDEEKATMWEIYISGEDGLAAAAKEIGELANPDESLRRDMINQSGMGRFQRKSTGYENLVNKIFKKK